MAAELVASYMKEQLDDKRLSALNKLVKGVLEKQISLVELVEKVGPYLTNQDVNERCKGTQLLALVLHRISSFKMLEKEVNLLADFFCDRFRDHYSVIPHVVSGLLALISYQTIPSGLEVKIVQAFFKEVHVQSLVQADRHNVYYMFKVLLNKSMSGLQSLGGDFVFGFIQAMDGEKDPRNLLVAFELVQIIIRNFPVGLFAEDLFEVTSCYFPIDFTPPANDPNAITRGQLIAALRNCLSATSLFAPFCLPLLLEKLSSDVVYAKKDALLTLAACAKVYDSRNMAEFVTPLWTSIKREIFTASDSAIEFAGYEAVKYVVQNISRAEEQNHSGTLNELLTELLNECQDHLSKPDHKLMKTSATLLQTVAMASDLACSQVLDYVLPILLKQFELHPQINNQKAILDVMLGFLQVAKDFTKKGTEAVLAKHKERLIGLFFLLLVHSNPLHRSSAVAGLVALVSSSSLTSDEVAIFLDHLVRLILNDKEKIVRHEAKLALAYLSSEFPSLVRSQVVAQLTTRLTVSDSVDLTDRVTESDHVTVEYLITTLASLCTSTPNVEHVVPCFMEVLTSWSQKMDDSSEAIICCVLDGFQTIFDGCLRGSLKNADYFKETLLPCLIGLPIANSLRGNDICFNTEILERFSKLTRRISSYISAELSADLVTVVEGIYLDKKLEHTDIPEDVRSKDFDALKASSPWQQTQLVSFLTSTLCNISKTITTSRLGEFLPKLLSLGTLCKNKRTNIEAAKCLAGLINRINNDEHVDKETTKCLQQLDSLLEQQRTEEEKWRATIVLIWLSKALLIRGHSRGISLLNKLLDLFSDQVICQVAADGFYIIISTPDDVMTNSFSANIKLMYEQRIFIQVSPLLTERFHSCRQEHKHLYLCALSHVLRWLPKQVLLGEIPNLLPLLVQSLSCEEVSLQLSTLDTFYSLTHDVPKVIAQYVTSLVPRFLHLAQKAQTLKIRSKALKCLGVLTVLPHHIVFPYKIHIVRTLAKCLDDHKRLVRKEAVKCRNEWILLGTAVE